MLIDIFRHLTKSDNQKFVLEIIAVTLVFSLFVLFLTRYLDYSKMWTFGDLVAYPLDVDFFYSKITHIWNSEGLGVLRSPMINISLVNFSLVAIFGGFVAQKISLLSAFPIAFLTSYFLLRHFKFKTLSAIVGALLYSVNPVTISSFTAGGIGQLVTFAVFPLFIIYVHKLLEDGRFRIRYVAIIGLISILIWNIYVAFWYGTLVLIPFFLILFLFGNIRRIATLRLIPVLVILAIIFVPGNLILANIEENVSKEKVSVVKDAEYTFSNSNFRNVIRLAGNAGSPQISLDYNRVNDFTVLGLLLAVIAISSVIFVRYVPQHNRTSTLIIISSMVSLIVTIGFILLMRSYPNLVDYNSIFASLRNPEKLQYPLTFSFVILATYGFEQLLERFGRMEIIRHLVILVMFFAILFYNYPALDGTLGLKKVRGEGYVIEDKYYKLSDVLAKIDNEYSAHRFMILPWEYETSLRINNENPNFFGMQLGSELSGLNAQEFKSVLELINSDSNNKAKALALFDVKYLVVDKTFGKEFNLSKGWVRDLKKTAPSFVYYDGQSYWLTGDPNYFYTKFKSDSGFALVYEGQNFAVFKVNASTNKFYEMPYTAYEEILSDGNSFSPFLYDSSSFKISYEYVSPTLYKISMNATKPFILSFAESYHPSWEARVYYDGKVERIDSNPLFGLINSFPINQVGDIDIVIENKLQKPFELGVLILELGYLSCLLLLFIDWRANHNDTWVGRLMEIIRTLWQKLSVGIPKSIANRAISIESNLKLPSETNTKIRYPARITICLISLSLILLISSILIAVLVRNQNLADDIGLFSFFVLAVGIIYTVISVLCEYRRTISQRVTA